MSDIVPGETFMDDLVKVAANIRGAPAGSPALRHPLPIEIGDLGARLDAAYARDRAAAVSALEAHRQRRPRSPLFVPGWFFDALGLSHRETAHTRLLAWFLVPRAPHGLGHIPLLAFLDAVNQAASKTSLPTPFDGVRPEQVAVTTEEQLNSTCRADIVVRARFSGESTAILIEAKVNSTEGLDQTRRYDKAIGLFPVSRIVKVYLTKDRHAAESDDRWIPVSYRDFVEHALRLIDEGDDSFGLEFFRLYLAGVLTDVCDFETSDCSEVVARSNDLTDIEALTHGS